jgi:hypothetical protein
MSLTAATRRLPAFAKFAAGPDKTRGTFAADFRKSQRKPSPKMSPLCNVRAVPEGECPSAAGADAVSSDGEVFKSWFS